MSKFTLHDPDPQEVLEFIKSFPRGVDLSPWYFSRVISLHWFGLAIRDLGGKPFGNVCVVSGSEQELELNLIEYEGLELFSFQGDGPLDMRMGRTMGDHGTESGTNADLTAAVLVNTLPERDLADLLYQLGEERASRRVARAIVLARAEAPIETTGRLASIIPRHGGERGCQQGGEDGWLHGVGFKKL